MLSYIPRRVTIPHITALGERRASQMPGSLEQVLPLSAERLNRDLKAARSILVFPTIPLLTKMQLQHVCASVCRCGSGLLQQWVQLVFHGQTASTPSSSCFSSCTRGCKSYSVAITRSWTELWPSFLPGPKLCLAQLRERRENKVFFLNLVNANIYYYFS